MGLFSGAEDVRKAIRDLEETVEREVAKNGGRPIDENNSAYLAANKAADDAIKRAGWAVRALYGG